MSYILDALKKSEQDRQKTAGPTLQTVHRPVFADSRKSGAFWGLSALCAVLSVALVVITWGYSKNEYFSENQVLLKDEMSQAHPGSTARLSTNKSPTSKSPASENKGLSEEGGENVSAIAAVQASQPEYDVVKPKQEIDPTIQQIIEFWELPDPVQQEIPALTFSFHVYSENSERRTIIINNRRVKEGDKLADGLRLVEITVSGVVLNWKRFNFRVNVVDQW